MHRENKSGWAARARVQGGRLALTTIDVVEAAKQLRTELKREFPATKFRVRTDRFSGGESIDVHWRDGPALDS